MTLRGPRRFAALVAAPALVATGVTFAAPAIGSETAPKTAPTYKGSALALSAKVGLAGTSILDEVLPALVTYPPGSAKTLIELPPELAQLVALKVLNASSEVKDGVLTSNAHTASLGVLGEVITARVLNADCTANQGNVTGDSQVAGLTLAGTKIPVDPGPNLKIEIPAALASFVTGSIVIDEQTPIADGGLQIRALHINLVVAPSALDDALNSVLKTVRDAAEQVKVALEDVTGKTLDELLGKAAPSAAHAKSEHASKNGAQSADQAKVRAAAAAPKAPVAAPADAAVPADAAAPAEVQKSDGADLNSGAAASSGTGEQTNEQTGEQTSPQTTAEQAEAARAERVEKGAPADQAAAPVAPRSTDPTQPAPASPAAPAAPAPAAPAPAHKAPDQAKTSGSDRVLDKAQSAIPSADSIAGALGVDIIVSQVTCEGKPGVAAVSQLPHTGGDGHVARNIAVTGLGLLVAGGAAVAITRRRRSSVGPAI